jgi:hypothetical protein
MSIALLRAAPRRLWACGMLACVALLLTSGCGPDYKARAVVKGKVTLGGKKSLTTGTVMFYGKDGITASASIDPDGNYEMNDAPLGECQVTVTVQGLPSDMAARQGVVGRLKGKGPAMPAGPKNPEESSPPLPSAPKVPKEIVPIDSKYAKPDTSGLKFTVQKGEQTFNIDL